MDTSGGESACWPWVAARDLHGYGYINWDGRKDRTHRVAYILGTGREIPEDRFICHMCDNPPCCNPNHLFAGTSADNIYDMDLKGRRVAVSGGARLSVEDVRLIRDLAGQGVSLREIAERFRIHPSHASRIVIKKRWFKVT